MKRITYISGWMSKKTGLRVGAIILRETEKAYLAEQGNIITWVPKSQSKAEEIAPREEIPVEKKKYRLSRSYFEGKIKEEQIELEPGYLPF